MKKITILTSAIFLVLSVNATPFKKGTSIVNGGIGLNNSYSPGWHSMIIPPIFGNYELGITQKVGIGYISVGAEVGISSSKAKSYTTNNTVNSYNYFYFSILARSAYHFDFYELSGAEIFNDLDVYAGLRLGPTFAIENDPTSDLGGFTHDIFIGSRYYFTPSVGAFAEAGYGLSNFIIGLSFKL